MDAMARTHSSKILIPQSFQQYFIYPQHGLSKLSPTVLSGCTLWTPDKRLFSKQESPSSAEQIALAPHSCSWGYKLSMKTVHFE